MNSAPKQSADSQGQGEGQHSGFLLPQLIDPSLDNYQHPPPPPPRRNNNNNRNKKTMLLLDLFSKLLRVAELAFAATVAGLTGKYLRTVRDASPTWQQGRFIYTEAVAGLSVVLALVLLLLVPAAASGGGGSFAYWPVDSLLSVAWFVAFGLLVNWLHGTCGYVFDWDSIGFDGPESCDEWKADLAFAFLSAIVWLVSAILGIYWIYQRDRNASMSRRWYQSSV